MQTVPAEVTAEAIAAAAAVAADTENIVEQVGFESLETVLAA